MTNMQMTRTVWTTRELAEAAAQAGKPVTQEYIRQLCKRGAIPATQPGRDWLIADEDAQAWLESWSSSNEE
jgi:excisionase family DNA binding protein